MGTSQPPPFAKTTTIHFQWHHSIAIILSCRYCSSQPLHRSVGPPRSLSGTMARCLGNHCLLVLVGSAGRQLDSAPPLQPPSSYSTKPGISLSLHPMRNSLLCKASVNRQRRALMLMATIKSLSKGSWPSKRSCATKLQF